MPLTHKKTREQFIIDARKIHGDKYNYDNVIYINNKTKVEIICPIHGKFLQTPNCHLNGQGCPECGEITKALKKRKHNNEFIDKANKVHNNKYDYSNVIYNGNTHKVDIICPIHGVFKQTPNCHLKGCGCPKCKFDNLSELYRKDTLTFIKEANVIHNNYYYYDKVIYKNSHSKVTITCPTHGDFQQTPHNHIKGQGCPKCNRSASKNEKEIVKELRKALPPDEIIELNDREIIAPYELDIYLPKRNFAIEYNGLRYHTDKKIDKNYHLDKIERCKEKGVHLIHIFEDDYLNNRNDTLTKIYVLLGLIPINDEIIKLFNINLNNSVIVVDRGMVGDEENNIYTQLGYEKVRYLPPNFQYYINRKRDAKELISDENNNYEKIWDSGYIEFNFVNDNKKRRI